MTNSAYLPYPAITPLPMPVSQHASVNTLSSSLSAYEAALDALEPNSPVFKKREELKRSRKTAIEELNNYNDKPKKRNAALTKLYDNLNNSTLLLASLNDLNAILNQPRSVLTYSDYDYLPPNLKNDFHNSVVACYQQAQQLADTLLCKPHTVNSNKEMGLLTSAVEAICNLYKDPVCLPKLSTVTAIATSIPTPTPLWQRLAGTLLFAAATAALIVAAPFMYALAYMGGTIALLPMLLACSLAMYAGGKQMLAPRQHFFYKSTLPHQLKGLEKATSALQSYSLYTPAPHTFAQRQPALIQQQPVAVPVPMPATQPLSFAPPQPFVPGYNPNENSMYPSIRR